MSHALSPRRRFALSELWNGIMVFVALRHVVSVEAMVVIYFLVGQISAAWALLKTTAWFARNKLMLVVVFLPR